MNIITYHLILIKPTKVGEEDWEEGTGSFELTWTHFNFELIRIHCDSESHLNIGPDLVSQMTSFDVNWVQSDLLDLTWTYRASLDLI